MLTGSQLTTSAVAAATIDPAAADSISLDARNEPVRSVLLRSARLAQKSISLNPGVEGYVTVSLTRVRFEAALSAILSPLGYSYHKEANVYVIEASAHSSDDGIQAAVVTLRTISAATAADKVRSLFPDASIRVDASSNALIVVAPQHEQQELRLVVQGLDSRNPTEVTAATVMLHFLRAAPLAHQLRGAFASCRFDIVGSRHIIVSCRPQDSAQVLAAIAAIDAPAPTPIPAQSSSDIVRIQQADPVALARSVAAKVAGLQTLVAGTNILLTGAPDAVNRGRSLLTALDVPPSDQPFLQVYRVRTLDAASVADLLRRAFPAILVTLEADINALAVTATSSDQQRIASAIAQLDATPTVNGMYNAPTLSSGATTELVTLQSAVPSAAGANDILGLISQTLQSVAPDVRVIPLPTTGQIALVGPPVSVRSAREFIEKIDRAPRQVVLDTEVLEIDETVAKNLGLQLGTAILSTTYSEVTPPPNFNGGTPQFLRLQGLTRTPLSFSAELNLLIQNGKGRVLADPRITTLSGRTASIKAGDNISILTTTAGSVGTIATTQVQSFQTGVTLDITPLIDDHDGITVTLHPVVNSLVGLNNGVPEISTRDTQTTVRLRDNQTLVIGGLIQENDTRTTTKLPVLGDLPVVGKLFRSDNINSSRNELVIVVTPHIVDGNSPGDTSHIQPLPNAPTPVALPTVPPGARLSGLQAPSDMQQPTAQLHLRAATESNLLATPEPTQSAPSSPLPAAFGMTNVFTFGSPPQSNFARSGDPVTFFYATFSPTVISNATSVSISAITTSNATAVKLLVGNQTVSLSQSGPGQWLATFHFPLTSLPPGQTSISLSLTASRGDGSTAAIAIPINIRPMN